MVVAKAKNGLAAAQEKESSTVQGMLKKVGMFCAMIVLAASFQLMGSMSAKAVPSAAPVATPKLQASHKSYPASYYDKSSSHYMGGAHNVLINAAANGEIKEFGRSAEFYDKASSHYQGGVMNSVIKAAEKGELNTKPLRSHNAAQNVLLDMHEQFKRSRNAAPAKPISAASQRARVSASRENMRQTGAFVGFIAMLAVTVAYFVTFKAYHAHLAKQDQLTALLNNPNARVAAGKKGKEIAKRIQSVDEEAIAAEPAKEPSVEQTLEASLEKLLKTAKAKKVLKAAAAKVEAEPAPKVEEKPKLTYEAPQLVQAPSQPAQQVETAYQLLDPVLPQHPLIYPQNFQVQPPVPIHQLMTPMPKVAISKPEPMAEPVRGVKDLSKAELIKLLLTQLAKESDLEK